MIVYLPVNSCHIAQSNHSLHIPASKTSQNFGILFQPDLLFFAPSSRPEQSGHHTQLLQHKEKQSIAWTIEHALDLIRVQHSEMLP